MSENLEQENTAEAAAPVPAKKAPAKRAPAKKAPAKRVRRTKAQIEADEIASLRKQLEIAQAKLALKDVQTETVTTGPQLGVALDETKIYHIVEDGFTALGRTWYRGQEITIKPGSKEAEESLDRFGNFLFDLTEKEQMLRYDGTVFFRPGPWPGLPFNPKQIYVPGQVDENGNKIEASPAEIAALEAANQTFGKF